jgi:hypothetical protein
MPSGSPILRSLPSPIESILFFLSFFCNYFMVHRSYLLCFFFLSLWPKMLIFSHIFKFDYFKTLNTIFCHVNFNLMCDATIITLHELLCIPKWYHQFHPFELFIKSYLCIWLCIWAFLFLVITWKKFITRSLTFKHFVSKKFFLHEISYEP